MALGDSRNYISIVCPYIHPRFRPEHPTLYLHTHSAFKLWKSSVIAISLSIHEQSSTRQYEDSFDRFPRHNGIGNASGQLPA